MSEQSSLYAAIGGEEGVAKLVAAVVHHLRTDPAVADLRALYDEKRLQVYECRMREFLSGWLGGPALYQERHGMPMLRESHRHKHITVELMGDWMRVMRGALEETVPAPAVRLRLEGAFARMAESLVNHPH